MKRIIIYYSKTGFTERYARWISEELGCEAITLKESGRRDLTAYDTIIYGAGLHAGKIPGVKKFLVPSVLTDGRLVVFATGAIAPQAPELTKALRPNFTDEQWSKVKTFYMQAGLNYERMGVLDRALMAGLRAFLRRQEGKDSDAYRMVSTSFDLCDRAYIAPLVDYCRQM